MTVVFDLNRRLPALAHFQVDDAPMDTVMVISVARRLEDAATTTPPVDRPNRPIPALDQAELDAITWADAEWQ